MYTDIPLLVGTQIIKNYANSNNLLLTKCEEDLLALIKISLEQN
jgi:hypothetical protein